MKISFTAVTAQHMLLLCVNMSRDNLNSAFGPLVLWCLFFDNKDAVGETSPRKDRVGISAESAWYIGMLLAYRYL